MSSRKENTKGEAISHLYETIKSKFEKDGILKQMRCMLQSRMITMMKGKTQSDSLLPHQADSFTISSNGAKDARDSRFILLNQLIMEYFHWHGFHYSAEMFAMETATDNALPVRECLEGVLGTFEDKSIPILLELVVELMAKS